MPNTRAGPLARFVGECPSRARFLFMAQIIVKHSYPHHLQASILDSWIYSFVYVRNVCAHHSRLWDKILAIAPQLPPGKLWDPVRSGNKRLYCIAMTLNWMLAHDSVDQAMHAEWKLTLSKLIASLFAHFPQFQGLTGFPPDWENLEVWKSV